MNSVYFLILVFLSFPMVRICDRNGKTRRGRIGRQVANTLLASGKQGVVTEDLKIRKVTQSGKVVLEIASLPRLGI